MPEPLPAKRITLRKNEHRRIAAGHPWVFSNEVREITGNPAAGDVVELLSAGGVSLGFGFHQPHSLICFRLLSHTREEIDAAFFVRRIRSAQELRVKLYPEAPAYRVVHGESDYLPGLIVDRYGEFLVLQTLSFGMDARLTLICDALESVFHPAGILERNESPLRTLEGLPLRKGVLRGGGSTTVITEHGIRYNVDLLEGQKTGFFLDQRENRRRAFHLSGGARVLDCFCNDGGFALNAAKGGAVSVLGIDISGEAVQRAQANAALNGLSNVRFQKADVFETLAALHAQGAIFDLVILDPPSFTRSRKSVTAAKQGYRDLHVRTFRILRPGGILMTASCSYHIEPEVFLNTIVDAGRRSGKQLQILDWSGAASDHPLLPNVPETRYLKFGVFRVLDHP